MQLFKHVGRDAKVLWETGNRSSSWVFSSTGEEEYQLWEDQRRRILQYSIQEETNAWTNVV